MLESNQNFEFPWPILKVVVEGTSILDVPRLEVQTMEEATTFIRAYGFDPSDPEELELIWKYFDEAIDFIERSLGDPQYARIPDHLRSQKALTDIRRLLLLASDKSMGSDQVFACAILRVMHVLIHLAFDPRLRLFDQVQNQILSRLDNHLYIDNDTGATYLGKKEDGGIKLLFFKKKDRKDREREIIKLLHKAGSLVEEIYDRIGFRMVTETRFEAMKAVRLLLERNIISLPNVRPGRARNRLIDLKRFQFEVDRISAHIKKNAGTTPYIDKLIRRVEGRIGARRLGRSLINPHTSEHYRAIQFTCRELVKFKSPAHQTYLNMKRQLENIHGGLQVLNEVYPKTPQPHEYVFFPYEIQIMDVKSYADSIFGKSNHEEYRRKQVEVARNRIFGRGGASYEAP